MAERQANIEGIYGELELLVDRQLLLQAPVADQLRLLLSVLRILPGQEPAHRLALHVAEHATHVLSDDLSLRTRGLVERMGDTAADMSNKAANAWYEHDQTATDTMELQDDDMDSLYSALVAGTGLGNDAATGDNGHDPGSTILRAVR